MLETNPALAGKYNERIDHPAVAAVFDAYPARLKSRLMRLRGLILEAASTTQGVGKLGNTFRMRLLGTEVISRFDRDAKGIWMDEDENLRNVLPDFYAAVEDRTPRYRSSARHAKKEYLTYDRIILPLASDGETVDMIIGVLCFD